jgi:cell wall integrity and stress response component
MKSQVIITALALFGGMATAAEKKLGCYKSTTGLKLQDTSIYNSVGHCGPISCPGKAAFAMIDKKCFCGDEIPADEDKVDDSKCTLKCPGYPPDTCGGLSNHATVYDNGLVSSIPKADSPEEEEEEEESSSESKESSTPSATTSAKPSLVTIKGETIVVTAASESTPSAESSSSSKPNVAGIAAGVVVGVIAIAAIAGGLFLFMRNRKRRAIEEEHKRNAAISNFVGKPPMSSSGTSSFTDTRLDPVMAQRRMSDGSIADNQDYSRRILKVTNA